MEEDYKLFLLNIRELTDAEEEEELWRTVREKIDSCRRKKLEKYACRKDRAACAGAGLMLQWAAVNRQAAGGRYLSLEECLSVENTVDFRYTFTGAGKPSVEGYPFHFSLSHSGEYVLLAVSSHEIGADIQKIVKMDTERLAKRFFTPDEQKEIDGSDNPGETFFSVWTRKEAYAKYTGEGMARMLGCEQNRNEMMVCINIQAPAGYAAAVCYEQ